MGNGGRDPGAPRAGAADPRHPGEEIDQHRSGPTMADPDVVLQIPHLRVDDICAEVDDLDAHVSLRARLGGLFQLDVGAQARLGTVRIDIRGVTTEAMLEVRLDELNGILDRAFDTVDRNPQIVEAAVRTPGAATGRVDRTTPAAPGPPTRTPREPADTAGGASGSPGRTAWRRMKRIAKDGRPLRRAAARLLPGAGPEPRRDR
ncbi:hypothetical protein GCE86_14090 [Micromonospora terminaliae]|uniref:Uncharacterized protein n=1 Tax=Micromonospora terminaliae TaxID=1914461 RepID=A0AAJ3DKK8_9ACTN|nr:hypothetical protein [Micromonospora terminaliae]NES27185.1 hypothetical protein [Micromonospora terminaliae]QGL48056.1 hypothetical protein GCE86_14090 [Micromonospora terminaliae]